ncbi:MAG: alpha/beta hydrolase [Ignavibacteria bacterium]|nr:alpha/beta hydrolase [Ignavibacteria bacterium]
MIFVAGWISLIKGWKEVLRELTRDFTVYYIETREKISSRVNGKAGYGVEDIGSDLVCLVDRLTVQSDRYILMGSSLGATAILESYRSLTKKPRCLVLVGPNAVFRVPSVWKAVVTLFYPGLYALICPAVKWYLRTFRLNVHADRAQYEKYSDALDAADPWKLKKAVMSVWSYEVWSVLKSVDCPTLIVNASKDKLHEPEILKQIAATLPNAMDLDLETNARTHSKEVVEAFRSFFARLPAPVVPTPKISHHSSPER